MVITEIAKSNKLCALGVPLKYTTQQLLGCGVRASQFNGRAGSRQSRCVGYGSKRLPITDDRYRDSTGHSLNLSPVRQREHEE